MSEMVGHAPLFFAVLLNNQNHNAVNNQNNNILNQRNENAGPIPGTMVPDEQIIQVNYLRCTFQIELIPIHSFPLLGIILGNITIPRARTLTSRS